MLTKQIGGYAYVYRVRDTKTKEVFALKQMICQVLYCSNVDL